MTIASVDVRVVEVPGPSWAPHRRLPPALPQLSFVTVRADDGTIGGSSTWLPGPRHEVVDSIVQFLRPILVGRPVDDRAALWHEMQRLSYLLPIRAAVSAVDIALWDLAGRRAGRPTHRLLGTVHTQLDTYASVPPCPTAEAAAALALECQSAGFRGFKLHTQGNGDDDIVACEAVRAAVGPGMALILDPVNTYDRRTAARVARATAPLDLCWLEAPLPDDDVEGYVELRARAQMPIANGEARLRGLYDVAELLRRGAVDIVRYAADLQGGITGLQKAATLCEGFGVGLEGRAYGSTFVQAAHLHGAFSSAGSTFYEVPYPKGWLDFGMAQTVDIVGGVVLAPDAPGLGVLPDWDVIEDATVAATVS